MNLYARQLPDEAKERERKQKAVPRPDRNTMPLHVQPRTGRHGTWHGLTVFLFVLVSLGLIALAAWLQLLSSAQKDDAAEVPLESLVEDE